MRAEVVAIGTEILLGHIVNTNTAFLSDALAGIGIDVFYHTAVGDNPGRLSQAINNSLRRSDIVITTGGLGPTVDDITLETISGLTGKELVFKKGIYADIKRYFKKRGFSMPKEAKRQAFIPRGATSIRNDVGTAPGLIMEYGYKIIIALPGPPREMQPMVGRFVTGYLKKLKPSGSTIKSRVLKLTGLPESHVNARVKDLLELSGDLTVGIYAHLGQVDLKITCKERNEKKINYSTAEDVEIIGSEKRIPDGIVYINGLPLVVFEFKSAIREEATIYDAFKQLTVRYRRDIPELFKYNAFCVISDGVNNKSGSFFAPYEFFYGWRRVAGLAKDVDGIDSMFTLIQGMFHKNRLRDIIRNFIYIPDSSKKNEKIVCRYPQYYAARALYDNIKLAQKPEGNGKG